MTVMLRTTMLRTTMLRTAARRLTLAGSLGAGVLALHAAVNARLLRVPTPPEGGVGGRVSVLVPARDEAHRIAACLDGVLSQEGVDDLEVLVLDDESRDATAAVVAAVAQRDARVRLLRGGPLPPGWLGKPHACAGLAAQATGDVLVFLDADVHLRPHAVSAAVALLRRTGVDLVCPYPRQLAGSAGERLVQPLLQWSWLSTLPLRLAERSPRESLGAANGQFLVVDAGRYHRAGGHAAVRAEVLEDIALLRAVKRAGGRGGVVDGTALATCRMYSGWHELAEGYTKSLWSAFGSPAGAAAVVTGLATCYVVPPLAALAGSPVGAAGYLAGVAGRAVAARRTGSRVLPDSLAHPVSVTAFGWLVLRSWRRRAAGTLAWKGRPLPGAGGR